MKQQPTLAQVKTTAKKRHQLLLKRLNRPAQEKVSDMIFDENYDHSDTGMLRLADIYETMSVEAGFKNWATYSAHLKNQEENELDEVLYGFINPLFSLKEKLFIIEARQYICDHFKIENSDLAPLTAAVRDLIFKLTPQKNEEDIEVPVEAEFDTRSIQFFDNIKTFIKGLKAVQSGFNVCWRCRFTNELGKEMKPIIFLNVEKDLRTLKYGKKQNNKQIHLCNPCAADYMNSFNRYSEPNSKDVWFVRNGELVARQ